MKGWLVRWINPAESTPAPGTAPPEKIWFFVEAARPKLAATKAAKSVIPQGRFYGKLAVKRLTDLVDIRHAPVRNYFVDMHRVVSRVLVEKS